MPPMQRCAGAALAVLGRHAGAADAALDVMVTPGQPGREHGACAIHAGSNHCCCPAHAMQATRVRDAGEATAQRLRAAESELEQRRQEVGAWGT